MKIGFEGEFMLRFTAIFNVEHVAVLTMTWSCNYVRTAMIV